VVLNVVVVGVGGQGILSLSRMIGEASLSQGWDVRVAETHGLSQRGGSVIVYVRIGKEVIAPTISEGEADLMLALELIEAARYSRYLRKGSFAIINDKVIKPSLPGTKVPPAEKLKEAIGKIAVAKYINASETAIALGNPVGANMVVFGYFSRIAEKAGIYPLDKAREMAASVGGKRYGPINEKLFMKGAEYALRDEIDEIVALIRERIDT
jgi:indolepyruvate ferredoxin oxidoreductase beta subunit